MSARISMPLPHPQTAHELCSIAHVKNSHQARSQLLICTCASCDNIIFSTYLLVPHQHPPTPAAVGCRCDMCGLQVSLPASPELCLALARVMAKMAALLKAVPGRDVREKVSCSCPCCCTLGALVGLQIFFTSGFRQSTLKDLHIDLVTTITHTYILT